MNRRYRVQLEQTSIVELERLIDLWIKHERNRLILKDKLLNGLTFDEIANKYDLSDRQVKTIVYKGEDIIFTK